MKILVVDDDRVLLDVVSYALRRAGYEVIQAFDGHMALERWRAEKPALVLLDVNMPRGMPPLDGFGVCLRIREECSLEGRAMTPVILLTVRADDDDVVRGLGLGADDYIVKPFSPRLLIARVEAVLRRSQPAAQAQTAPINSGGLRLETARRLVKLDGEREVTLTMLECRLLEHLILANGHILPADALIDLVWGPGGGDKAMLRQLVRRLRAKIDPDVENPRYIETVAGVGYGFKKRSA
jgi:DNA-binding response OmpR family regulator